MAIPNSTFANAAAVDAALGRVLTPDQFSAAAAANAPSAVNPLATIVDLEQALVVGEGDSALLTADERAALALASAPSESNPLATRGDLAGIDLYLVAPTITSGALGIDLANRADVLVDVVLTENVSVVIFSNPRPGGSRVAMRIAHGVGGPYTLPLSAWAGVPVVFRGDYVLRQDEIPTRIFMDSFDGFASVDGWVEVLPSQVDTVSLSGATNASALHAMRLLYGTAALTYTVGTNNGWAAHESARIQAHGGDFTVAASGVTINSKNGYLKVARHGFGVLKKNADGTFTLSGDLVA